MNKVIFTTALLVILGAATFGVSLHNSHASTAPNRQDNKVPVFRGIVLVPEAVSPSTVVKKSNRSGEFEIAASLDQFCIKKLQEKGRAAKTKGIRKCIGKVKKKCKKKIKAKGKTPNKKSMKKCIGRVIKS